MLCFIHNFKFLLCVLSSIGTNDLENSCLWENQNCFHYDCQTSTQKSAKTKRLTTTPTKIAWQHWVILFLYVLVGNRHRSLSSFPHAWAHLSEARRAKKRREHWNYPVSQLRQESSVLGSLEVTSFQVHSGGSTITAMTGCTSYFSRHVDVCYCIWSSPRG